MLAKLKIAFVLLIIGSLSGLAIVGVHTLTEDRIEQNQLESQNKDYLTMFPEMKSFDDESIDDDDDVLDKKITVYDGDDNEIGEIYRGHDMNERGNVTVLVGIHDDTLVDVIISDTENTPSYVEPLESNHISKLSGVEIENISYDSNTGATQTYDSVQKVIDAAVVRSGGEISDPELSLYSDLFEDVEDYGSIQKFDDRAFDNETAIYDSGSEFLGFAYRIPLDEGDVYMLLDLDDAFLGFFTIEEDAESEYGDVLEAFASYEGNSLDEIDHSADGDVESTLVNAIDDALALVDGSTRINHDFLSRHEPYMVDDSEEGTLYTGMAEGYDSENVIKVAIDDNGEIASIELVYTNDTVDPVDAGDYSFDGIEEKVIDELNTLYGKTDITESDTDDAFAGASTTGDSIYDVVHAALEYDAERTGE